MKLEEAMLIKMKKITIFMKIRKNLQKIINNLRVKLRQKLKLRLKKQIS